MNRAVVLGITGSIAAYKACEIISLLSKRGFDTKVVLSRSGEQFITKLTLETLSRNPVATDMFHRDAHWEVEHISLAKAASAVLIAPASANVIARLAAGMADDMITCVTLATRAPVIIAPAMNTMMFTNPVVQSNIASLKARGFIFVEPAAGRLACGDTGTGRLAEVCDIVEAVEKTLEIKRDMEGFRLLVSAGPTREDIDPVRYITNRSSGKMGFAIAGAAARRGAEVTIVAGPVSLETPPGVKRVDVVSSDDMKRAVWDSFDACDGLIMAAAPADFTPESYSDEKLKKNGRSGMTLSLRATEDILAGVGRKKGGRTVCGFAAETHALEAHALEKLTRKNLDMIAANDVSAPGCGFMGDTNDVTLYMRSGEVAKSGAMTKRELADWLIDRFMECHLHRRDGDETNSTDDRG